MTETDPFDGSSPVLAFAYIVRFLLEIALLCGIATLAWNLASGWWRWAAMILAVAAAITIWGLFLSPKADFPPPTFLAYGLEALLFVGTGVGLFAVGFGIPAGIGVAIWLIDTVTIAILET